VSDVLRNALRSWLEPRVLVFVVGFAAASSFFIKISEQVSEGETHGVDAAIMIWLRPGSDPLQPIEPRWLESFMRDLTALGSIGVLSVIVGATSVFLHLVGRPRTALFVLFGSTGGAVLSSLLKELFDRSRPDVVSPAVFVSSASFPSGHAMSAAVVYLTLGALIARLVPNRWVKLYVLAIAGMLVAIVGISRVVLGVHWPSDVLAGWAAGGAWALGCWGVAQVFKTGMSR
jgi:undecaprenyl-diphosphatase